MSKQKGSNRRYRYYKKPRKHTRIKRRRARWWASLSPEAQALYTEIWDGLQAGLNAELDKQIIYGEGTESELTGLLS